MIDGEQASTLREMGAADRRRALFVTLLIDMEEEGGEEEGWEEEGGEEEGGGEEDAEGECAGEEGEAYLVCDVKSCGREIAQPDLVYTSTFGLDYCEPCALQFPRERRDALERSTVAERLKQVVEAE